MRLRSTADSRRNWITLIGFIFQVILKTKDSSSASVLNSYNFTILRSVFYSRNVCVPYRNSIHFLYSYVTYVTFIFLLVFAARISVLFFSDGEHIDSREARFFGSATQVKPCRAGLRTGRYPPLYPVLKVSLSPN